MSSYFVSNRTIDRILIGVEKNGCLLREVRKTLNKSGSDSDILTCLGRLFLTINKMAVNMRYQVHKDENEKYSQDINEYEYRGDTMGGIPIEQSLKSAQCLKYQCSQGYMFVTKAYKILEKIIFHLSIDIISKTSEYQLAEWS